MADPAAHLAASRTGRPLGAALLLTAALFAAATQPGSSGAPPRVECRAMAGRLLATIDLEPALDAALEQRLGSGLTSTVRLTVTADGDRGPWSSATRDFEVRFDPWTETFDITLREHGTPGRSRQAADWPALHRLLATPDPFDLGPLAGLPETFTVEVRLELDPVTARQLEQTREQLTHPAGGPAAGGRSLLGTLAALLLRAPPPEASRFRSAPFTRAGLASP